MIYRLFLNSLFILSILLLNVFGQLLPIKTYSIEEGLAQSQVQAIIQDSLGYLWFGTRDGLSRFDGSTMKTYTVHDGLTANSISSVFMENDSLIWFGHNFGGITLYYPFTHKFKKIVIDTVMLSQTITAILKDRNGVFWFAVQSVGLIRWDGRTSTILGKTEGLEASDVRALCLDGSGRLWAGTPQGITVFAPEDFQNPQKFFHLGKKEGLRDEKITALLSGSHGEIWIGTKNSGVIRYKEDPKTARGYRLFQISTKQGLTDNWVWSLLEGKDGHLWVGTFNGANKIVFNEQGQLQKVTTIRMENGLKNGTIYSMYKDREANIWFGTFGGGVSRFRGTMFLTYNRRSGLPDNVVWSIIQDDLNRYWFATEKGIAIFKKDRVAHHLKLLRILSGQNSLPGDFVMALYKDRKGMIWAGVYNRALCRINPHNWRVQVFSNAQGIDAKVITSITEDKRGRLWVASVDKGVFEFNPSNGRFIAHSRRGSFPSKKVNSIYLDQQGKVWFATKDHGLVRKNGEKFEVFSKKRYGRFCYINMLTQDSLGNYWVATGGDGAYRVKGRKRTHFDMSNGLSGDYIFSIHVDRKGFIWFGTKKGVDRFNPSDSTFRHFDLSDGFYGGETNLNAVYESPQGELWFGCVNGAVKFCPEYDVLNTVPPKIVIEDIQLFRQNRLLPPDHCFAYDQNYLTFYFKGLSFTNPQKVQYQFRLKGFEQKWSPQTSLTSATYSNLPPGKYQFEVKARNNDGVWATIPAAYQFEILTPFWKNWSFIALSLLLGIFLFYEIVNYRIKRVRKQNLLLEKKVRERTSELTKEKEKAVRAFKALEESEENFRALTETAASAIFIYQGTKFVYANKSTAILTGYPVNELIGKNFWDVVHPDFQHLIREYGFARQKGEKVPNRYEFMIRRKDGMNRWIDFTAGKIIFHGKPAALGTAFDITEKKQAEEALLSEKEKLAIILKNLNEGVIATDENGAILFLNEAAQKMLAASEDRTLVGTSIFELWDFYTLKGRKLNDDPVRQALEKGRVYHVNGPLIMQNLKKERLTIEFTCTPLKESKNKLLGCVATFWDITERQKLEEELFKARKLESLGVLAGGLAHDFNNILTAIIGNISLIKLKMGDECPPKLYELLEKAEVASSRAQGLTQQLLTFSKGGAPIRKITSIQDLVIQTTEFVLRGSNIKYEFSFEERLWPAEIDEGQISQVINNLVINAMQAMPNGGKLWISGKNIFLTKKENLPLEAGYYVELSFKDTGHGMSAEIMDSIFDPYFSTKKKGSGLGLASVFSILKKHDGHIIVNSEINYGSTFTFYLPASPDIEIERVKNNKMNGKLKGNILVMDDEADLRDLVKDVLESVGFMVTTCSDGQETIVYYSRALQAGKPFDLVILDLTVPGGMGGKKTIEKLLKIDPNVRAIVSSGYSNDPIMSEYEKYGFMGVVSKPYSAERLVQITQDMILKRS